ncbi:MAG: hypothetical protein R3312_08480 [Gammaproteobacteria bacterium]|nr:hypothetical protein [Gammaproteobacteria bacterium]
MAIEKPQAPLTVDDYVLKICELGCTHVYQVIELIEQGHQAEELSDIPAEHLPALLLELQSIMAVYEASDKNES